MTTTETTIREPHPRADVEAAIARWDRKRREREERDRQARDLYKTPEDEVKRQKEAAERSTAEVATDAFFGPLLDLYDSYKPGDGMRETPDDLKAYLIWTHRNVLADIPSGRDQTLRLDHTIELVTQVLEMDVSIAAFLRRLTEHFAIPGNEEDARFVERLIESAWFEEYRLIKAFQRLRDRT